MQGIGGYVSAPTWVHVMHGIGRERSRLGYCESAWLGGAASLDGGKSARGRGGRRIEARFFRPVKMEIYCQGGRQMNELDRAKEAVAKLLERKRAKGEGASLRTPTGASPLPPTQGASVAVKARPGSGSAITGSDRASHKEVWSFSNPQEWEKFHGGKRVRGLGAPEFQGRTISPRHGAGSSAQNSRVGSRTPSMQRETGGHSTGSEAPSNGENHWEDDGRSGGQAGEVWQAKAEVLEHDDAGAQRQENIKCIAQITSDLKRIVNSGETPMSGPAPR